MMDTIRALWGLMIQAVMGKEWYYDHCDRPLKKDKKK
jgi:hypothetical protein